jgi:hypothetical protein
VGLIEIKWTNAEAFETSRNKWEYLVEAELTKELPLIPVLPSHHRRLSCRLLRRNHCSLGSSSPFFDSIDPLRTSHYHDHCGAQHLVRRRQR